MNSIFLFSEFVTGISSSLIILAELLNHFKRVWKSALYAYQWNAFENIPAESIVWMNHGDSVTTLPEGFQRTVLLQSARLLLLKITLIKFFRSVSSRSNAYRTRNDTFAKFYSILWRRRNMETLRRIGTHYASYSRNRGNRNVFLLVSGGLILPLHLHCSSTH